MQMYSENGSEKTYIRKLIQEMKQRYKVRDRTVQVADKGLNFARNIYAAVLEVKDGYILFCVLIIYIVLFQILVVVFISLC